MSFLVVCGGVGKKLYNLLVRRHIDNIITAKCFVFNNLLSYYYRNSKIIYDDTRTKKFSFFMFGFFPFICCTSSAI